MRQVVVAGVCEAWCGVEVLWSQARKGDTRVEFPSGAHGCVHSPYGLPCCGENPAGTDRHPGQYHGMLREQIASVALAPGVIADVDAVPVR